MSSQNQRETALILQFPPLGQRGRKNQIAQANGKQSAYVFEGSTSSAAGSWYHEAAIVEAERSRKP
jgi:hypothetical protein